MIGTLAGVSLLLLVLVDGFETILQPRRITRRFRYARLYYQSTWALWRAVALRIASPKRREGFLSLFGPLSLLGIFTTWVMGLILGFGLLHWSIATPLHAPEREAPLATYLYLSGTTFFTLGYGDVTPIGTVGRALAVIESGLGFGFLAVIISYLPVLFGAFSQREVSISLLDARGGSPPTAAQVLLRLGRAANLPAIEGFLREWERWAAELLESHLSFPVLSYYRSQHDNQSWVAALASMLDTCALLIAEVDSASAYQAQLTFAMARHAAVDLCLVLRTPPVSLLGDRLPPQQLQRLRELLREARLPLRAVAGRDAALPASNTATQFAHDRPTGGSAPSAARLAELRALYEPFVAALAQRLLLALPPVLAPTETADNWQRSAWTRQSPGIGQLPPPPSGEEHFS